MNKYDYKVFIASSLTLRIDREEVEDAINEINENLLMDKEFSFSYFDYVKDESIVQKIELNDAQDTVRPFIKESLIFVLIVRGRIGNITINEYEDAMKRFKEGRLPRYVFIFNADGEQNSTSEDNGNSITFEEFEEKYLSRTILDSAYRTVTHKIGYPIPFDGKYPSLKSQLVEKLTNLVNSEEWPFPNAIRNIHIKKTDFYNDRNRVNQCYENIYFRRIFDDDLEEAISNSNIIFLSGLSLSGKTRAAMNLLASRDVGWTYIFPNREIIDHDGIIQNTNRETETINKMEQFLKYLEGKKNVPLHYIFIDDIHELDFNEEGASKSTKRTHKIISYFLSAAINGKFKLIVTSTKKYYDTFLNEFISEDNDMVRHISIQEMTHQEFDKAISFFDGYGLIKQNRYIGYNTPGALLINLPAIKHAYLEYLKCSNKKTFIIRQSFLKAIKATSIWKRTNLGKIDLLKELVQYFITQKGVENWVEKDIDDAIKELLSEPLSGITQSNSARLNIQEYIYHYLIDYDGNIINDDKENLSEKEKTLVSEILSFCDKEKKDTYLTMQVCKLGARTNYYPIIGHWLYELFEGELQETKREWLISLKQERISHEADTTIANENNYRFYYSKIFSNALNAIDSFTDAYRIYKNAKRELRSPNLLADLMRHAKSKMDWETIKSLDEYKLFVLQEKNTFVLGRLMSLEKKFMSSQKYYEDIAEHFSFSIDQVANYKLKSLDGLELTETDRQIQREIFPLYNGIETLAKKVSSISEFKKLLELIRKYYYIKINDRRIINLIIEGKLDILSKLKDLTIIDLLSVLRTSPLRKAIQGAFGQKFNEEDAYARLEQSIQYIKKEIFPSLEQTLNNNYTDETKLRITLSTIVNSIIEHFGKEINYSKLFPIVRDIAVISHPLSPNRKINILDCYAYHFLLRSKNCGALHARNLLEEFLIPHTSDKENPLIVAVYLLNTLINTVWKDGKISEESRRSIIKRTFLLYEEFHIYPDAYTYNILIRTSEDEHEAIQYIESMLNANVSPDIYSLCHLVRKADNLRGPLGLVNIKDKIKVPQGYEFREMLSSKIRKSKAFDTIKGFRDPLLKVKEFWKQVFFRELKSESERKILFECYDYIKTKIPELLTDNTLKNVFIQNPTNLLIFDDIKNFINENWNSSFPDSYTFTNLTNRLAKLEGNDKKKQLAFYNDLTLRMYNEGRLDWDSIIVRRLLLYSSYNEHMDFIFFCKEEINTFQTKDVTPIGYLHIIKKEKFSPNLDFLYKNLKQIKGYDTNIKKIAMSLFPYTIYYSHNQKIVIDFQNGKITDIKDSIKKLNWNDYTSTIQSFNLILDIWSKRMGDKPEKFKIVMELYDEYLKEKGPASETLSRMVKNANNYNDVLTCIYPIFDITKKKRAELILDSHFLSSLYRFGKNAEDLKQYTQVFEQKGGKINLNNAASMIRYMLRFTNDQEAQSILKNISCYLLNNTTESLDSLYSPISQITRENVNGQILYSVIIYATKTGLFKSDDIVQSILSTYRRTLKFTPDGLFHQLITQPRRENKKILYQLLIGLLETECVPYVPENVLTATMEGVTDYSMYCCFITALRKSEYTNIDPIISPLLIKLYDKKNGWIRDKKDCKKREIRQLYSRIVTYSKINCLKNGHLLPSELAFSLNNEWDKRSIDCSLIRTTVNMIVGERSLEQQLQYAIKNLPDSYLAALKSVYYYERPRLNIDGPSQKLISDFENAFAMKIWNEGIELENLESIPMEWEKSGWIPKEKIVASFFLTYYFLCNKKIDKYIREKALKYYNSLLQDIRFSFDNKKDTICFLYKHLGGLEDNYVSKKHRTLVNKLKFIEEVEKLYVSKYLRQNISFDTILQIPVKCEKKGWRPGVTLVSSIFLLYKEFSNSGENDDIRTKAKKYYTQMCNSLYYAKKTKSDTIKFMYKDMGSIDDSNNHFTIVDRQQFYNLTKKYIL